MDERALSTYLNAHLAGSTAGLWTVERLADAHPDGERGATLRKIRDEIREERTILRDVIQRLPKDESTVMKVAGAAGAVVAWTRAALPIPRTPTSLEQLEALAVGVWGKRLLWGTLAKVAAESGRFEDLPLDDLAATAERQERDLLRLRDDAIVASLDLAA
jgi:hypothetical protein